MAIAFIQVREHPAAYAFYKDFAPSEPVAPSGEIKLTTFHKLHFKTAYQLLRAIATKANRGSEILIVTHGTDQGLHLSLTSGNTTQLERESIEVFMDPSISRVNKRSKLQMTETQLKLLEAEQRKVAKLSLKRVEFRACYIGADSKALAALRNFFGAQIAGGPDLQDAYSPLPKPFTGRSNTWWTSNPSAQIQTMSGGERVGYVLSNVTRVSFGFQWAVDSLAAQKAWVRQQFPLGKSIPNPPAIHGILDGTTKLIFPGAPGYRSHLKSA